MKHIDPHILERVESQEEYNIYVTLRILDKLDELVDWINKQEKERRE